MTDDEALRALLRTTLPAGAAPPARDLWPEVTARLDIRPRWSPFDVALAALVAAALLRLPEALWLLALAL